jgi:uncharacterized protein YbaR (Trm112 family)
MAMAEQTDELPADLMEVLRCPLTRSRLRQEGQWLIGETGGLRYPIRDGFPVLLVEEAKVPPPFSSLDEFKTHYQASLTK